MDSEISIGIVGIGRPHVVKITNAPRPAPSGLRRRPHNARLRCVGLDLAQATHGGSRSEGAGGFEIADHVHLPDHAARPAPDALSETHALARCGDARARLPLAREPGARLRQA